MKESDGQTDPSITRSVCALCTRSA